VDGVLERLARTIALVAVVVVGAAGCATFDRPCDKIGITVAQKEERTRVDTRRGTRVTATGSIEETQEPVRVVEYFVRAAEDDTWHRITEREFEAIAPKQRLEVCR
jgi:hypothetical protein